MQPGDAVCTGKGAAPGSRRRNESADACKFRDCQRRKSGKEFSLDTVENGKNGIFRVDVEGFLQDDDEDEDEDEDE